MQWIYKHEIIPAVFVILALVIFGSIYNSNERENFKENGVIANAFVTGYMYDYRGRLEVKFRFFVNAKTIEGKSAFPELRGGTEKYLINKYFPVIYIKSDPEDNELLASPSNFKKFSIAIPDSLLWLKQMERPW